MHQRMDFEACRRMASAPRGEAQLSKARDQRSSQARVSEAMASDYDKLAGLEDQAKQTAELEMLIFPPWRLTRSNALH